MMFNKILVITAFLNPPEGGTLEESFKINNYLRLAQDVFKNLNPATDIYFSTGPMDVLDHSCSKLGFGGKMCIDGTTKFAEETETNGQAYVAPVGEDEQEALTNEINKFSEIKSFNTSLIRLGVPCIILSVEKNRTG